jgi:uncharacterized protein YndB with AHSA1/START domain
VRIDASAPIKGSAQIEVGAAPEVVWDVLTAIDEWPRWNPDITESSLEGDLAEGSQFRWKAGAGTITSTLRAVDRPRLIAWTGKTLGLEAVHLYRIDPLDAGSRVTTEESWVGWPARLFRKRMQRTLERALDAGLEALKAEGERRAR